MYGQMTAGSWIYIGTPGHRAGHLRDASPRSRARRARRHRSRATIVLTAGLGGMGGAQPLAATMNGGVALVHRGRPGRGSSAASRRATSTRSRPTSTTALARALAAARRASARSASASSPTPPTRCPRCCARGFEPDLVTDQTSAHDPLAGYVPAGACRSPTPTRCARPIPPSTCAERARRSPRTCAAMLELHDAGAEVFDYGNNIRAEAQAGRLRARVRLPRLRARVRAPAVLRGQGPVPLGGAVAAIRRTSPRPTARCSTSSPTTRRCARWIALAAERIAFQGLPARICWLGYGERARPGLADQRARRLGRGPARRS